MGVHLYPHMLSSARARTAYASMVESELKTCLRSGASASWGLIACTGLLRYFGILITEALRDHVTLGRGERFAFDNEVGGHVAEDYKVEFHGDRAVAVDYVV